MNFLDILILLLIAFLVIMAWRSARRHGGCGGDCRNCAKSCGRREEN